MIDSALLLKDLKARLVLLQRDLVERAEDPTNAWGQDLKNQHHAALERNRTGKSWVEWRDDQVDQAAVAWIVSTTFLRFCEDNRLLVGARLDGAEVSVGWIAGPEGGTERAEENLEAYVRADEAHRSHNRRHWLQQGFRVLAAQPAGSLLIDPDHNPVWEATISGEAAADLMDFWRTTHPDGSLVHDFTDPDLDTRFLGDLYQDLSEHAKKTYALLQTPVFVEEFILEQTLTPALREFPLDDFDPNDPDDRFKLIDPTCGSGHFLLGAFERLHAEWLRLAPAMGPRERVRRAMESIHGVDLNPFAVAIARFRLTVAGLRAAGESSLVGVEPMGFHLAIGDSLLGDQGGAGAGELDVFGADSEDEGVYEYATEDLSEYHGILEPGQYHVVVGNPPYITVKDKKLNAIYREAYTTAVQKYALSVPFMELFFRLALNGESGHSAGFTGQITANSFMKRGFGKVLIEHLFAGFDQGNPVDLLKVIDTSGAYIPGHGTPTVIIIGRRRRPQTDSVRAVLGVRGEPGQPTDPAKGLVWSEIVENLEYPGYEGPFVSVDDLERSVLSTYPWSLTGGGAVVLRETLDSSADRMLGKQADSIGITSFTLANDVFVRPQEAINRSRVSNSRPMMIGENVRDFTANISFGSIFPYNDSFQAVDITEFPEDYRTLWPFRFILANGKMFGGKSKIENGLKWYEYGRLTFRKFLTPHSLVWPDVATHNHFILDRGGVSFNQHAPVIKLPEGATVDEHMELLGVLNSSVALYWLRSVSYNKGNSSAGSDEPWEHRYEFTGTKLQEFPLPAGLTPERGRLLDALARELQSLSPAKTIERWKQRPDYLPLREALALRATKAQHVRARMIFEQEELDWDTYRLYGLLDEDLTHGSVESEPIRAFDVPMTELQSVRNNSSIEEINLGERAFEIALARQVAAGTEQTAWFERHGSTPITEIPDSWPQDYVNLVERRLDVIAENKSLRLLEKPEFKRRWVTESWEKQEREALEAAILDRLEDPALWKDAQSLVVRSIHELADLLRTDTVMTELARVYADTATPDLPAVLTTVALTEAVPYLAAHRYKNKGLEKFRTWQDVWDLQRREDAGETVTIPVPPKYTTADFRKPAYWKARGKLDVPKERFILYPDLHRSDDPTPVLGWAGWDHRDQAIALARELPAAQSRVVDHGQDAVVPLVAGLVELEPWLHQWHAEIDPTFGVAPAAFISGLIDQTLSTLALTRADVAAWMPPAPTRGRKKKS
ncbi:BREX-2 system adenine-specific DNA-methyltransferase PglX [Brevibacterium litoralis]|uniref:BREX-2 system adenine-specific DNA-methyltransferase PglX n=1 Tax=Brevibacterium litoralis TaxID=3138935 RepID=UPI0032EF1A19